METYCGVIIEPKNNQRLPTYGHDLVQRFYCLASEPSPQHAFARAANAFSGGDQALAQRLYNYAAAGWFMFSSPILSNAPLAGEYKGAMPIACFVSHVADGLEHLIAHDNEVKRLSVTGGGVGGSWSGISEMSDTSPGVVALLHVIDTSTTAFRQGRVRRGSYAAYLDISHPDIVEFISMRNPSGDYNRKNLNLHHAVNITDAFMVAVQQNQSWPLISPVDQTEKRVVMARALWEQLLETRYKTGEPYLNFIDTINRNDLPSVVAAGWRIHSSNLCNEIHLPTDQDTTAVCCLSSLNLACFRQWRSTNIVKDLITMLDNVLTYFIAKCPDVLANAKRGAQIFRPLGLGVMGLAQLFQQENIAFASPAAGQLNEQLFSYIKTRATAQTLLMGQTRGPCSLFGSTGPRNAYLLAIAPTANSSMIVGASPSIEPWITNAFTHRSKLGSHQIKNPQLEQVLAQSGHNTQAVWDSIILNLGSVSHLPFLSEHTKLVFATAYEIDQTALLNQAAARQKFICQGQSLTLFLPQNYSKNQLHRLHIMAWTLGCKGLYYIRTRSGHRVNAAQPTEVAETDVCAVCQA